jgi:hypothetical protein
VYVSRLPPNSVLVSGDVYHVDPRPSCSVMPSLSALCYYQQYCSDDAQYATPPYGQYYVTDRLPLANREAPHPWKELSVYDDAHDGTMRCE